MKKFILLSIITVSVILLSIAANASVKIKPVQFTTEELDAIWAKTPFITNILGKKYQIINYGKGKASGIIFFFAGKTDQDSIKMSIVEMPTIMNSQSVSVQIFINGKQNFFPLAKGSYQVYDNPKNINGLTVIRTYIGKDDPEALHYYVVMYSNASGYETEMK